MNHIGAKPDAGPSAWDQLAQTQNYEHPVRQQSVQQPPVAAPPIKPPVNNQAAPTPPPPVSVGQQPQAPEYGEELHPELVRIFFLNY